MSSTWRTALVRISSVAFRSANESRMKCKQTEMNATLLTISVRGITQGLGGRVQKLKFSQVVPATKPMAFLCVGH
jgi:hypothetical protein